MLLRFISVLSPLYLSLYLHLAWLTVLLVFIPSVHPLVGYGSYIRSSMVPCRGRGLLSNVALLQLARLPLFDETGSLRPSRNSLRVDEYNSAVNKIKENSGTHRVQSPFRSFPQRGYNSSCHR